jgi:ABC-type antimicrobial peptide transport system ATPase subunit
LEVRELTVQYRVGESWTTVVDDLSLSVAPGKTLGLVGESGLGEIDRRSRRSWICCPRHAGRIPAARSACPAPTSSP